MVQIDRIEVDQLFGLYDHRIQLHPEERITLLHGPNGVGKTVMLRLLYGLLNGNFEMFYSVPFKEFRVWVWNKDRHLSQQQKDRVRR
ncbi:MAG: hypothetical protein NT023_20375 [Armatimonadetes bacterium]|nr:hypothetical protein [Armatimonadota bacterium]